eukprot:gene17238-biopygen1279
MSRPVSGSSLFPRRLVAERRCRALGSHSMPNRVRDEVTSPVTATADRLSPGLDRVQKRTQFALRAKAPASTPRPQSLVVILGRRKYDQGSCIPANLMVGTGARPLGAEAAAAHRAAGEQHPAEGRLHPRALRPREVACRHHLMVSNGGIVYHLMISNGGIAYHLLLSNDGTAAPPRSPRRPAAAARPVLSRARARAARRRLSAFFQAQQSPGGALTRPFVSAAAPRSAHRQVRTRQRAPRVAPLKRDHGDHWVHRPMRVIVTGCRR